ncbi:hypothetical protein Scep_001623 [Stephania cephalantha]|uniref:EF-hand domain-containing protein n=1 Tax=Stephania cephalantha TaxID=152367 RepID=A0AAP0Q3J0_9MAGN
MAITGNCNVNKKGASNAGKQTEMTLAQFREWLDQFDDNKDGCISEEELREAVRSSGKWFTSWRSRRGIRSADANGNGSIDSTEITKLIPFAEKTFGFKILVDQ